MGFFDDIVAQQDGGGMLGGLPATWQYANPESLSPVEKQMMAMVGTQNPDKAGFAPLPASTGDFPVNGAAPITGLGGDTGQAAPTIGAPPPANMSAFNTGAPPALFVNPPGSTPGNPMMPPPASAPAAAPNDGEEDAPAANAPASPMAIGNYQMPRVGTADQFKADPAMLPANAQATQGLGAPGQVAAPSVGDNLMTGYQNLRHGGGIIGSIVAAVTGKRNDAYGAAQQQQAQIANQTARALIGKGVDPTVAMAAVQPGNTEMLNTLVKEAFGSQAPMNLGGGYILPKGATKAVRAYEPDEKFQHVTRKNGDGTETLVTFDPSTGKYTDAPAPASLRAAVNPDSTGKERMAQLVAADPNYARKIQAMVDGDMPMPTSGQAARSPQAQRMVEDVLAVDGATSASDFATRAATRKDYASGIASRVTKSINTTIGHFATLEKSIDKLGNYSYFPSVTNWVHDKYSSNMDPEYQKAKSQFEVNKEAAIKELDFALSGGHSSVTGSAEIRDKFHRADSPETLHAAVAEAMSLLDKRLQSHSKAYNEGTKSQRDGQDFIYPENRAAYNKLRGSEDTSTDGKTPASASAVPSLQVGQSAVINGVPIKKVSDAKAGE